MTHRSIFEKSIREYYFGWVIVIFVVILEIFLFIFIRHLQNDVRLAQSNWITDSLPSFNLALGLPIFASTI